MSNGPASTRPPGSAAAAGVSRVWWSAPGWNGVQVVPSHAGRNNRVMHLIGHAGTYTPPEGGESNHWIVHMNSDALSLGTYSIPAGGVDDQEPHTEDEVYVVQAGRATLVTPWERWRWNRAAWCSSRPARRTSSPTSPKTWP